MYVYICVCKYVYMYACSKSEYFLSKDLVIIITGALDFLDNDVTMSYDDAFVYQL